MTQKQYDTVCTICSLFVLYILLQVFAWLFLEVL